MMMSLIVIKNDYIFKANNIYINLREYEDIFEKEAKVIGHAKCYILQNDDLDDYMVDGIYVSVYNTSNGYKLVFDEYVMELEVYDRQIVDFKMVHM